MGGKIIKVGENFLEKVLSHLSPLSKTFQTEDYYVLSETANKPGFKVLWVTFLERKVTTFWKKFSPLHLFEKNFQSIESFFQRIQDDRYKIKQFCFSR